MHEIVPAEVFGQKLEQHKFVKKACKKTRILYTKGRVYQIHAKAKRRYKVYSAVKLFMLSLFHMDSACGLFG